MLISTAIILAGGLGTRLRSVVNDLPKCMAPVNGKPFLTYVLDYLITQNISKVTPILFLFLKF
jgi:D-glycero-alpha-D-manno-heptose 1-phosphate guanylyltransferase